MPQTIGPNQGTLALAPQSPLLTSNATDLMQRRTETTRLLTEEGNVGWVSDAQHNGRTICSLKLFEDSAVKCAFIAGPKCVLNSSEGGDALLAVEDTPPPSCLASVYDIFASTLRLSLDFNQFTQHGTV